MEENRSERGPTAFADLERLREELDQLGLRIRRSSGEVPQERRDEPQATLTIRGR